MNARRNTGNRLSGSSKSRVLVTGPAGLKEHGLAAIEDWRQLLLRISSQAAVGLKEANPLDSVFALKPTAWGERGYDAVTQIFAWLLADAQQRPLLLEIGFDEFTEPALQVLENASPDSLQGALVIGRVQQTSRGLSLHPYAVHRQNGEVIHLCLDNLKPTSTKPNEVETKEEEGFEEDEEAESESAFSPAISRVLDEVDDGLLALAEAGLAALNPLRVERVRQIAPRAERLGLQGLTTGLGNVVDHPRSRSVLCCSYLSQLHRRAMPLSM
jgi:hypothetical protein